MSVTTQTKVRQVEELQYVVVLNEEEARALGALRHCRMGMGTKLYKALQGLPAEDADFGDADGRRALQDPVYCGGRVKRPEQLLTGSGCSPLGALRRPLPVYSDWFTNFYRGGARTPTGRIITEKPSLFYDTSVFSRIVPVGTKGHRVQYKAFGSKDWKSDALDKDFDVKPTRNQAYTTMRARGARFPGWNAETSSNMHGEYRVVSADTKDGPELDRGHYRAQYWAGSDWVDCIGGPGLSGKAQYDSLAGVKRAIREYGCSESTYRAKWYPGKA